ncbi:hypothetical protein [Ottowia testudinis]|uniref:Uncharacterized protein n=1 Tax=Ottowia testudinis TaxID=2816950 RepID=A0A975CKK2_9BURK|nr:hypothetical protein [Ottowia testudinis]QTD46702.1 hypothetical protein J1M35_07470 [Ottowia testudinis]
MDGQLIQAISLRKLFRGGGYASPPDVMELNFDGESMLATLALGAVSDVDDGRAYMTFTSAIVLDSKGNKQELSFGDGFSPAAHRMRTTLALNSVLQLTIEYGGYDMRASGHLTAHFWPSVYSF